MDFKPENLFICPGLKNFESLAGSREGSNFNPVLRGDRTQLREYTEIQRYRDTEIQRYKDIGIQRYRDTRI